MFVWLFCALALAQEPAPTPALPEAPLPPAPSAFTHWGAMEVPAKPAGSSAASAPVDLRAVWAGMPRQAVLEEAVDRILAYDLDGAAARLRFLEEAGRAPDTTYRLGYIAELQEDWFEAISLYADVRNDWPEAPDARNATFRMALCFEEVGQPRDSAALIDSLRADGGFGPTDAAAIALQRAITELKSGKVRRGKRHIAAALDDLAGTEQLRWLQARAHVALAAQALAEAQALPLGNSRRQLANLQRRAALINVAEAEVTAAAHTEEVDPILRGLLLLGDGYMQLHDALLAVPPPAGLGPDEVPIYTAELAKKARVLESKALRLYDDGVTLAVRTRYEGSLRATLTARRDALGHAG